jgi:large subunit ribosomal protein L30
MKRIKITQIKSGIDRNETAKRTLIALGLRKLNASVEVEATPQILGMVKRVGHLLRVEDATAAVTA